MLCTNYIALFRIEKLLPLAEAFTFYFVNNTSPLYLLKEYVILYNIIK